MAKKLSTRTAAEIDAFAQRVAAAVTESVPGTTSYRAAIAATVAAACADESIGAEPATDTDALDTD